MLCKSQVGIDAVGKDAKPSSADVVDRDHTVGPCPRLRRLSGDERVSLCERTRELDETP